VDQAVAFLHEQLGSDDLKKKHPMEHIRASLQNLYKNTTSSASASRVASTA
jgi:hypothetical protein